MCVPQAKFLQAPLSPDRRWYIGRVVCTTHSSRDENDISELTRNERRSEMMTSLLDINSEETEMGDRYEEEIASLKDALSLNESLERAIKAGRHNQLRLGIPGQKK